MIRPRLPLLTAVFVLCAAMAGAMGAGQRGEKPETLRVSGVVRLVGSSPLTELLISAESGEWHIEEKDRDKLLKFQQRIVTVEGEERTETLSFADGRPAGERRYLGNIRIVEPEEARQRP